MVFILEDEFLNNRIRAGCEQSEGRDFGFLLQLNKNGYI